MMVYGKDNAAAFIRDWLSDKIDIVLVTGRASYAACGAESFLAPNLQGKRITHLTTVGENARTEDVVAKQAQLPVHIDAFIAVGGGTVLDTTKLLRNGFPEQICEGVPYLALPTTAGTGAEATRFAVYYDHGKKMSADDVRYLPTDVALIPEFTATQSPYQRASTEFDAYAQAVESLWAKGATDESRQYATRALSLMNPDYTEASTNVSATQNQRSVSEASDQSGLTNQLLASYWAGRAIDISRTTAAHAFSYYMTATYGIPHGHAVYMMFPYICKNNGHPEFIKVVPGLTTLREFAAEKGLSWPALIDDLFANVNLKRLGNNPVEVKKESFL